MSPSVKSNWKMLQQFPKACQPKDKLEWKREKAEAHLAKQKIPPSVFAAMKAWLILRQGLSAQCLTCKVVWNTAHYVNSHNLRLKIYPNSDFGPRLTQTESRHKVANINQTLKKRNTSNWSECCSSDSEQRWDLSVKLCHTSGATKLNTMNFWDDSSPCSRIS